MKKHPILIFFAVISLLVSALVWFIQSPGFATAFKGYAARLLPSNLGVKTDFTEFAVKLFPPGVSLKNPTIELGERNLLKMPAGSKVTAERIDLNFHPFQMFSGDIRVHEVVIVNGDVNLILEPSTTQKKQPKKAFSLDFHWDELFQIRAEAVAIQDTKLHVLIKDTGQTLDFVARSMRLGQWTGAGGLGYELRVELNQIRGSLLNGLPVLRSLDEAKVLAHVNRSGAAIDTLSMKAEGVQGEVSGQISGDLLNTKEKKLVDFSMRVDGELRKISSLLANDSKSRIEMDGRATFTGKVRGNLERVMETARAEGSLEIRDPSFRDWSADRLFAEGAYTASPSGGEVAIRKAVVEAKERERTADGKPGWGGKVELGQFQLRLGEKSPIALPLTLTRAHIHWLAASEMKAIFPLQLRATGPVDLIYVPGGPKQSWQIQAKTNLAISDFSLDNQRLGQKKPMHRIFGLPTFKADGAFTINEGGVYPNGFNLSLPQSRFRVDGKIDFNTGYDLSGFGQVKLEEVNEIAGTPIRGDGELNIHVHGPTSRLFIDFDADLKNASYLNMAFGDFKGRVTWDDEPDHLVLSKLQLKKGETNYAADGMLDLGKAESLAIQVKIADGNIQDLIQVFDKMLKPLWWFPHTLNGGLNGEIQVFGGLSMDRLEVLGRLNGKGWEYLGERFDKVNVTGGYDKGRYHLSDFHAIKHSGKINGKISFNTGDERFDWDFHSQQFTVSDLDHVAQLDVPIRGKVFFDSVGKGRTGAINSLSQVFISDVAVRGANLPPSQLFVRSDNGRIEARGIALGGQGTLDAAYDFVAANTSYVRADLKRLDFSPILLLLNPRAIPDPAVQGFATGSVNLSFHAGMSERASGTIELSDYVLAKTGTRFHLKHPIALKVNEGSFDIRDAAFVGPRGEAVLALRGRQAQLEGSITGALDVSLAEFFTSSITQSSGVANLDLTLGGALKEPTLLGRGAFDGVSLRVPSIESPFENVTGGFQIRQNQIIIQGLEADLAGGRVLGGGTITLFADHYPTLALKGTLTGNKIKVFPFQYAKVRGNVTVKGSELPYLVEGAVVVDSALSREKVFQQKQGQSLKAVQYTPPPSSRRLADYPRFKLNIDVKADGGILVQNDLFDAELKAAVTIVNTLEAPRILGTAELIQGKMIFKDRSFQVQSARAVFDNPTVINPRFNMTSSTDVNGVKVQLYASGRIDNWKVELSSNPAMAESDIITLLALGMTSSDAKKLSSTDRAVFEQGEGMSLLLHALDFNREIESKTGIQIQLDESVNTQQGTSIFRPQSPSESTASPKIIFRKQISKNVDLSYGSTVGVGGNNQKEVSAEWQVAPGMSVLGVYDAYDNIADVNSKQSSQSQSMQSYGVDLKMQQRFK